ncbi:hypothetical protein [Paenisporosarcina cavernae]|uniref:Swarming motility protein SwrB n=1 Tax=Paenisporosarcina cavernae TaxID=2320858 RepID=A0A385YTM1_9BACL|nr:hypothetical protein [Paenisporosarcina cavernae]AYC29267.1 hypothetical protein D3873_04995 [Paenisporosarcina cavernae]
MTGISIGLLFILQIVAFYFIVMLYMKNTKLQEIERNQQKLLQEMEDSISLYLQDIQEENDRLIREWKAAQIKEDASKEKDELSIQKKERQPIPSEEIPKVQITTPKAKAAGAYKQALLTSNPVSPELESEEQTVHRLANEGKTAETIAKQLGKGKTEIELLLKFNRST